MKTVYFTSMMITAVLMLLLPLTARNTLADIPVSAALSAGDSLPAESATPEEIRVKISSTGETVTYAAEDYIFGVVAAEMPALYEEEALKAQAVAAYTYFLVQKQGNSEKEYDITDDYTVDQAFIDPEKAREKWGDGADGYEAKIRSAVKAVLGKKVTYNGVAASTVYHAISFGVTESAAEVWGGEYPYLVSVDSSWDKLNENYISTATFTAEELSTALSGLVEVKETETNCFSDIVRTEAGGVSSAVISGIKVDGSDIRKLLELRSANFEVEFKDGKYLFTTKGYGHAIGMSQYGAHYMAMQGKTWEEILLHYYPGCKIE